MYIYYMYIEVYIYPRDLENLFREGFESQYALINLLTRSLKNLRNIQKYLEAEKAAKNWFDIATIGFLPKKSQFFGISALLHEKLQS